MFQKLYVSFKNVDKSFERWFLEEFFYNNNKIESKIGRHDFFEVKIVYLIPTLVFCRLFIDSPFSENIKEQCWFLGLSY